VLLGLEWIEGVRIPPSGYHNHDRGRLIDFIDAETQFRWNAMFDTMENHCESVENVAFERRQRDF